MYDGNIFSVILIIFSSKNDNDNAFNIFYLDKLDDI